MISRVWVDASERTVAGLLRDLTVLDEVFRRTGHRVDGPHRWLTPGDPLSDLVGIRWGRRLRLRAVVRAVAPEVVGGTGSPALPAVLDPAGTGTTIRFEV